MTDLIRISTDSEDFDFSLAQKGSSYLRVQFGDHVEWVTLHHEPFQEKFCLSRTTSVQCCDSGPEKKEVDAFLDRLHEKKFGTGNWLNFDRRRLQPPSPNTLCQEGCSIGDALVVLRDTKAIVASIREKLRRSSAATWLQDTASTQHSTEKPPVEEHLIYEHSTKPDSSQRETSTRKRKRDTAELVALRAVHKEARSLKSSNDAEAKLISGIQVDARDAQSLASLISATKYGIWLLKKADTNQESATFHPFAKFIKYREIGKGDGEVLRLVFTELNEMSKEVADRTKKYSARLEWTYDLLSEGTRVKERSLDPGFSSTGDSIEEKDVKRLEKRCDVLCRIVNGLHEYVGGHAWGLLSALREANATIVGIRQLRYDRLDQFVSSAIKELLKCELDTIPDDAPAIQIPTILSWLQTEVSFSEMCKHLHLSKFAHEEPPAAAELDRLESAYKQLRPDNEDRRMELETQARGAMMMPLSSLRTIHLTANQNKNCKCSQHQTPLVASVSSTPQPHSRSTLTSPVTAISDSELQGITPQSQTTPHTPTEPGAAGVHLSPTLQPRQESRSHVPIQEAPISQQLLQSSETGLPALPALSSLSDVTLTETVLVVSTSLQGQSSFLMPMEAEVTTSPIPFRESDQENAGPGDLSKPHGVLTGTYSSPQPISPHAQQEQQVHQHGHTIVGSRLQTHPPCSPRLLWVQPPAAEPADNVDKGRNIASTSSAPSSAMLQAPQPSIPEKETSTQRPGSFTSVQTIEIHQVVVPNFLREDARLSTSDGALQDADTLEFLDEHVSHEDRLIMAFPNCDARVQQEAGDLDFMNDCPVGINDLDGMQFYPWVAEPSQGAKNVDSTDAATT